MNSMFTKHYNKIKGNLGEKLALNYVKKTLKYKLIQTNFKNNIGEIDIIAKDKNILVFIEVKYRSSDLYGLPREAVTKQKQNKIKLVATSYLKKENLLDNIEVRFDVIDILNDEVTYIKDAF